MCKITHERETIFLNLLLSENKGAPGAPPPLGPHLYYETALNGKTFILLNKILSVSPLLL